MRFRRTVFRVCLVLLLISAIVLFKLESTETEHDSTEYVQSALSLQKRYVASLYQAISADDTLIQQVSRYTVIYAEKNYLPPALIAAIIIEESEFNPTAVGKAGEMGLMQIHPKYWKGRFPDCGSNLLDIRTNLCYGTRILRHYIDVEEGAIFKGVKRYNGGSSRYLEKIHTRLAQMHLVERCY